MNLDMYAIAVKASLLAYDERTDIDIERKMGLKVCFSGASSEEFENISKYNDAIKSKYIASGAYNPTFANWRNFRNLHVWMERAYRIEGGKREEFEGATLRITDMWVAKLRQDVTSPNPNAGFFLGSKDQMTPDMVQEVLTFCDRCELARYDDMVVIYGSLCAFSGM